MNRPRKANRTIVFVTFETEWAPCGGLAAVMRELPHRMAQWEPCVRIAPFFRHIIGRRPAAREIVSTGRNVRVGFGNQAPFVEILAHTDSRGFTTYLLDSPDFFNAPHDPYLNPEDPDQLLQDALFFCAAVPPSLVALGYTADLVLNLQDWETAAVALTLQRESAIESAACILTLHNPYDRELPEAEMAKIFPEYTPGTTVLTRSIPFLPGPLTTVSENFALDLVSDPLHTTALAPHLQGLLAEKGIVGINNGIFGQLDFPQKALDRARAGDFQALWKEKERRREALERVLREYQPEGSWGSLDRGDPRLPCFLLFGRDDPRQKGYDVAAAAIERLPPGKARYIFTPLPGEEGLEGLSFLRELAKRRPGEVKVFPQRLERGYRELLQGSSFLVMCSLYEPFGGATEGYLVGTPVIARATGGLVQQIAPYPAGSLSLAARRLADRFHPRQAPPSGFLFREPDLPHDDVLAGWQKIVDCAYLRSEPRGDRIADRRGTLLFEAMVQEAAWALQDAIHLYTHDPEGYARMIFQGFEMLKLFSWDRSVREYQRVYDRVCEL